LGLTQASITLRLGVEQVVEKLVFRQPAVRYRDVPPFFKHVLWLKNEEKQKSHFLLFGLKKTRRDFFNNLL
jgi:hypothetical protein